MRDLGEGYGTRFEFECYDFGHLHSLAHFVDRGLVKPPFFIQGVFGILGGLPALPEHILNLRRTAQQLFGDDHLFSALGAGRHQIPTVTLCALLGGHVRVGLEDSVFIAKGQLARTNAQQVRKIRTILEELGYDIASPAEARQMLGLKGGDRVDF